VISSGVKKGIVTNNIAVVYIDAQTARKQLQQKPTRCHNRPPFQTLAAKKSAKTTHCKEISWMRSVKITVVDISTLKRPPVSARDGRTLSSRRSRVVNNASSTRVRILRAVKTSAGLSPRTMRSGTARRDSDIIGSVPRIGFGSG